MKKIFAILTAMLFSVVTFASRDVVPSDEVLAEYQGAGNLVVCIYVPDSLTCGDKIIFTGTYNGWTLDLDKCESFVQVEGYDGWWVVSVTDETDPTATDGLQGKPFLVLNGETSWNYQIGGGTLLRGSASFVDGFPGEIDIKNYDTSAPVVYTVDRWKTVGLCSAPFHTYKIVVYTDGCDNLAVPYIIGDFNKWNDANNQPIFQQMTADPAKSRELGSPVYYYTFRVIEGSAYQLLSGLADADGQIVAQPAWSDMAYLQELVDGTWSRINGGSDLHTGTEEEIVWDIRVDTLRWARCAPEHDYTVTVVFPEIPEYITEPAFIGGNDWTTGLAMTQVEGNTYKIDVTATEGASYKFKNGANGDWTYQLQVYTPAEDEDAEGTWNNMENLTLAADEAVNHDFSDADKYRWTPEVTGIENIVVEKAAVAKKVIVDGQLFIMHEGRLINVLGAQVK